MLLSTLLENVPGARLTGDPQTNIRGIAYDSRAMEPGFLFAAVQGAAHDGNDYIAQALERGAIAVLSTRPPPPGRESVSWVQADNDRIGLAHVSRNYYGRPDERMTMVGVTGTNGKTTVTFVLESIFREAGLKPGLLGTVVHRYGLDETRAERTTPESLDLYRHLDRFATAGARSCVVEVSSHSLSLHRVAGISFQAGVFTNLTQDHLDFHGTMDSYLDAKATLFRALPPASVAVLNADDRSSVTLRRATKARVVSFGESSGADVRLADWRTSLAGVELTLEVAAGLAGPQGTATSLSLRSPLLGRPGVDNVTAAAAAALALGMPGEAVVRGVAAVTGVPGRLERVEEGQPFTVLVDYAHTDAALSALLRSVRDLKPRRIITVFGCGGDRDRDKRPKMGRAAAGGSDIVVITSDNPRTEDPGAIIEDILPGVRRELTGDPAGDPDPGRCEVIPDRREGIRRALALARPKDCVVIAGKGHETHQIVGNRTIPFDDRLVVREFLRTRAEGARGQVAG